MIFYLRLSFGVLLVVFLIRLVDFRHLALILVSVKPELIALGLVVMMLNVLLKTYRWAYILRIRRPDIPLGELARFNFVSIFLGHFLPTSLSYDVVRVYYVSRRTADPRAAISSIFTDRILGSFSLAIVTLVAFLILKETGLFPIASVVSYGVVVVLLLAVCIPLIIRNKAVLEGIKRLLDRFSGKRLFESVQDMSEHLLSYWNEAGVITKALSISFLNLFIAVLEFYLIAKGFSAQVSIGYFFLFIPLVIFLSTLPISVGGIGLVEGGLVFFFSKVGMPIEMCLGTAVVYRALQLTCTLPGAAFYVLGGFSVKELPA